MKTTTPTAICTQCRTALRRRLQAGQWRPQQQPRRAHEGRRSVSSSAATPDLPPSPPSSTRPNPRDILSKPTWSVRSLLAPNPAKGAASTTTGSPAAEPEADSDSITPQTLHHLLRLSALPPAASAAEEAGLLATLRAQLRFVRAVQGVDTRGVRPLVAVRDETAAGVAAEQTVGLAALRGALAREDVVGHNRRPRRRREDGAAAGTGPARTRAPGQGKKPRREAVAGVEDWDVLAGATMTAGRYFVVRSGNGSGSASPAAKGGSTAEAVKEP
ncbi:uncharacterized protein JN550_002949 [Neoarthrinium moseri]|uniref:uncharacterized protein n=1 Tax=Neoarthrinium moseri TaxID=1658444 RepID=UPI001FDD0009|nr:uncharacterized protein JN550_002949 [Neoarthrinium moseri]KAI1873680.1 hypothetical protein JN550_002949 [Neoarthrinium moseri]